MDQEFSSGRDRRSITSPANGALSAGPVTPEGKLRSSRNAEKHGLYSRNLLLRNESAEELDCLRDHYYQRFLPANQPESDLVDQMIAATWRLRRLAAVEAAALDHAIDSQRDELDATYDNLSPDTRTHLAFDKLNSTSSQVLTTYSRFQAAQLRQYDRALRNFHILRGLPHGSKPAAEDKK